MGGERGRVFGVVVLTICFTSIVLVGGWYVAGRHFTAQSEAVTQDSAPAAPATKPKVRRTAKTDGARGATPDAAPTKPAGPADTTPGATADASRPNEDAESVGHGAAPQHEAQPAHNRAEGESLKPLESRPTSTTDAPTDARTIMEESQHRSEARFYRYDGLLQSFDSKENVTEKRWTFDRTGSNGKSKSVLRFTAPPEVKGVALLILNHPERASDQWMWTPSIERDRRIALQDRSTRFFGTDFSFEDLEERDVEQYDYAMLGSETIDGAACWKIQMTPKKTRSSQYTRMITWIRKDNYASARIDSFVKDDVVRRLAMSNIESVQGIWTARLMDMADLRRGTHTRLTLQQVNYNSPMKEDDFTLQAIRR